MLSQWKLVVFVFGAFAVAEGARRVGAQNGMNVNPSQTTPSQNPSQATPGMNPSMTTPSQNAAPRTPGLNPSMTTPSQNPSQTVPPLDLPATQGLNGEVPAPGSSNPAVNVVPNPPPDSLALSPRQLRERIRTSITQGPNAVNGLPAFGVGGIPLVGLSVRTIGGRTVLRGFARTAQDKAEAGSRAEAIAGEGNVVNELIVH
jgi:hypothetical protein